MIKTRIAALLLVAAALHACKKNSKTDEPTPVNPPANGTRVELSLDSLYLYARETYLWYDALPDYNTFNPRSYAGSDDLTSLRAELFKITQYKENPSTGKPYEYTGSSNPKYSFIQKGNAAQGIKGSVDLEGQGDDFGLNLGIGTANNLYYTLIRSVEKGSSAYSKDLRRSYVITSINGVPVSAVATDPSSIVNSQLSSSSTLVLTYLKKLGTTTTYTATVTKGTYTNDPVYSWKVFPANGSNITGYINLARFSVLKTGQASLDQAFADFAGANVNNLIVDLRYNGGGYVTTFEYLANLIAPASASGQVMHKETFNTLMQQGKAPILKTIPLLDSEGKQRKRDSDGKLLTLADVNYSIDANTYKYQKKGTLGNLKNVVFIVTGLTASASELTINSLKPYVNVKLVGSKTYGKPVGFFPVYIDKFTVYMSQFSSVNKNGEGNYYDGFTPDYAETDDITYDFGDPLEKCVARALTYINTGSARLAESAAARTTAPMQVSYLGAENNFNGTVEDRRVIKQ
ncbi:S41 family peptidase [Chitinophaga lutea]